MAASKSASYFDRKPAPNVRPALSHIQPEPQSPKTPQREISSTFTSPSGSYRSEGQSLIFEFGARCFKAGLAGEGAPRCRLGFGPEESRRVGDYRRWLPGYHEQISRKRTGYEWGEDHELWRMDLRKVDLGLVEDKIERAVREAYSKYLLFDSKSKRLTVILPSVLPHQLLASILQTLFVKFQIPSISLLSSPIACVVAAGCRSGLVVDLGWSETLVTGLYEYREVHQSRSTRATKTMTLAMSQLLQLDRRGFTGQPLRPLLTGSEPHHASINASFEYAEDVTMRMAWCQSLQEASQKNVEKSDNSQNPPRDLSIAEDENSNNIELKKATNQDAMISIPLPLPSNESVEIPFSRLAEPVETAFFNSPQNLQEIDDHSYPLHFLIYKALLSLPIDVRGVCMSRIMITGGGSNIPGLKGRLLDELTKLVQDRGWDPVHGKAADKRRRRLKEISINRGAPPPKTDFIAKSNNLPPTSPQDGSSTIPASSSHQIFDPIEDKLRRDQVKDSKPTVSGVIRGIETLGAWAGASLLMALKAKGVVEIERDTFLQYGLGGAKRDTEGIAGSVPKDTWSRNLLRLAELRDRPGWTLGAWA